MNPGYRVLLYYGAQAVVKAAWQRCQAWRSGAASPSWFDRTIRAASYDCGAKPAGTWAVTQAKAGQRRDGLRAVYQVARWLVQSARQADSKEGLQRFTRYHARVVSCSVVGRPHSSSVLQTSMIRFSTGIS